MTVPFLTDMQQIAVGDQTCVLTSSGGVKCWGLLRSATGVGPDGNQELIDPFPHDVPGLTSGVTAISAGETHTCVITQSRQVKCWLRGPTISSSSPTYNLIDVPGFGSDVIQVSSGQNFFCGLSSLGIVQCFGDARDALPRSTQDGEVLTIFGDLPNPVAAISSGYSHSCALMANGAVKCWGSNSAGQIGNGLTSSFYTPPTAVIGLPTNIASVSAGGGFSCAVTGEGALYCWGSNFYGRLGIGIGIWS